MKKVNGCPKAKAVNKALAGGKIASVVFTKEDGSERKMTCRTGVKKHLKGGKCTTDHIPTIVRVFEMKGNEPGGYKCFHTDKVISVNGVKI